MSISERPFESQQVAQSWERRARIRAMLMAHATERMLEAARLQPGSRVLDIGTGTAETAIAAARRVGTSGHVLAIDASPAMIEQATGHVADAGVDNVELRVMDATDLDLEEASVDAVIGRNAMMLLPGWPWPLRGFHRVLRPGGRLSFIVWGSREDNPFFYMPVSLARQHGWLRANEGSVEAPFSLSNADNLARDLEAAGFREPAVERVVTEQNFPEGAALLTYLRDGPMYLSNAEQLNPGERAAYDRVLESALEEFRDGDGYRIRSASLLASGTR